jgi:hypothetical protein
LQAAFALYLAAATVAMVGATVQVVLGEAGTALLVAILEANALLWLGSALRAGRQWGRLALALLAGVLVVVGSMTIMATPRPTELAFRLVEVLLLVAATPLMFLPAVGRWFAVSPVPQDTTVEE